MGRDGGARGGGFPLLGTGRTRGVFPGRRWGGRKEMEGILFALRAGAAGWRVSAASPGGARKWWDPLGVLEGRGGGTGFHGGAGGGEIGQNSRWKIEGEEVEESDRGFKASGSILRKRSLAGKLALPALAAGGREGLF